MPLQPQDILRVTAQLRAGQTATRVQNVFWWQATDTISQVFADIKADFAAWLTTQYDILGPWQAATCVADGFRLNDVTTKETYGRGTWTYDGNNPATEILPPQTAAEVIAYTFEAGRFGRKYLGPFVEGGQADGAIDPLLITDLQTFANRWNQTWVGTVSGNTYQPGVARKVGGVYQFKAFATALGTLVVPNMRTQRRRTSGFGLT